MADDFKLDIEGAGAVADLLDPKHIDRAVMNTVNTVATAHRKGSVKKAVEIFKLKSSRIKRDSAGRPTTKIKRASRDFPAAKITYGDKRPGLHHFATRKTNPKKGSPKFKIKKAGPAEALERGFFTEVPGGGHGLYQRKGKKNYPIIRRTGPSIKQMYEDPAVGVPIDKATSELMGPTFNKKLGDQLKKVKR